MTAPVLTGDRTGTGPTVSVVVAAAAWAAQMSLNVHFASSARNEVLCT
jgi:hypothetical protein